MNSPLTRPSAFARPTADEPGTLSPSEGERDGVEGRFIWRDEGQRRFDCHRLSQIQGTPQ